MFAEGAFIELQGLPAEITDEETLAENPGLKSFKPNEKKGRVLTYDDAGGKFTVQTLEGVVLKVSQDNLKEWEPKAANEGGFDVAWPRTAAGRPEFCAKVVTALYEKEYCVIETFMEPGTRDKAAKEAGGFGVTYKPMKKDFQQGYLGRSREFKTGWLESLPEEKDALDGGLDSYDQQLSDLSAYILPVAPTALGFEPYSRTNGLVLVPFQNKSEEAELGGASITDDDIVEGVVDQHILFMRRRKLCMLHVVQSGGGDVTLFKKDDDEECTLTATSGRLIVFRHDKLSYAFTPSDTTDVCLQAWLMTEPIDPVLAGIDGDTFSKDEIFGLTRGPNTPDGNRINVLGMHQQLPGGTHPGEDAYWSMLTQGTDAQIDIPKARFDVEPYFRTGDDWFFGFTYTHHGGFVSNDIYAIDAEFFQVTEAEAYIMSPASRCVLEVGYVALYNSGMRKKDLAGAPIGSYLGHSGDDWTQSPLYTFYAPWVENRDEVGKYGYQGRLWSSICSRISYTFGLKGPQMTCDTACSSSLVAYGIAHTSLRSLEAGQNIGGPRSPAGCKKALALGCNLMPGVQNYVGLSGPHMLSTMGRCFTFDHSADGYERGEGTGAILIEARDNVPDEALACMIGMCLNEDGRSASMTAPNGPAQQECIRGSMKEAGVSANNVICAECHGTGTALGDPIEVGALKGVMWDREIPLVTVSAKAHIGHLEAAAGQAGIQKCIVMIDAAAGSPNCHLLTLNPHLDVSGYPTFFTTELSDFGDSAGYSGVSSFGFGGANSRADVWAKCIRGARKIGQVNWEKLDYITVTCPFDEGPMHYLDGKMVPSGCSVKYKRGPTAGGPYHADAIRDEFDSYECNTSLYTGKYEREAEDEEEHDEDPGLPVFVRGTWSNFSRCDEMEQGEDGSYTCLVALGETRCERFHIVLDQDEGLAIYPVVNKGSMRTRVIGPDFQREGRDWIIDGRDEEVPTGTLYRINFLYSDPMSVTWTRVDEEVPDKLPSYEHSYFVMGTFTQGMRPMKKLVSEESENSFEVKFNLGGRGQEEFWFCRNRDPQQLIYPEGKRVFKTNVAVRGPDDLGEGKSWAVRGPPGELVTLRLNVFDAHITVQVTSVTKGSKVWESTEGPKRHSYFVTGSFNNWSLEEMIADEDRPGVFKYEGSMNDGGVDAFNIIVDSDRDLVLFPEGEDRKPGEAMVAGPKPNTEDSVWEIDSLRPEARFEVVYDPYAPDKRKVVSVNWLSERVDEASLMYAYEAYFEQY